jgi:hypothetical protein
VALQTLFSCFANQAKNFKENELDSNINQLPSNAVEIAVETSTDVPYSSPGTDYYLTELQV